MKFWDKALAVLLFATLILIAARCYWWAGLCFVCAVFIPEPRR